MSRFPQITNRKAGSIGIAKGFKGNADAAVLSMFHAMVLVP